MRRKHGKDHEQNISSNFAMEAGSESYASEEIAQVEVISVQPAQEPEIKNAPGVQQQQLEALPVSR
jgi:hypothetical protein